MTAILTRSGHHDHDDVVLVAFVPGVIDHYSHFQGMGTTSLLPTLVGLENATRLLLTSEFITGEQAKAMGLASESVDKVIVTSLMNNDMV